MAAYREDRPAGPSDPVWMRWQGDGQLHLFRGKAGELAVALCELMVPVAELAEPRGADEPGCQSCLSNWGIELSDQ